ncbi:major facilitator superfamily MFS_1 [Tsukamurella paurometabola DSM 20162]|uniref:Major facilitator superfamily MFS_1 n=2 Tax=Tsukamurella paurometabola TaxID=2061 RepID=D5USN1_TSUPD|nr:major facilitator superfamily MFS_1 [Tsukamurella paurometabola DSM 20162]
MYLGAGLGPLGGTVISPMLSNIGHTLHTSTSAAAAALTAYFVPFAALQLISGTLGERWGRRRSVRTAFLTYAVAALVCAVAPNITVFLVARVVMGSANAFTTPLLLASLADLVPTDRLSRAVGLFSSCLAAGQSFAPLVGGLAAEVGWQWGFVVVAVVACGLAALPPNGGPRPGATAPPFRKLLTPTIGLLSLGALVSYLGASSLPFLVALFAEGHLGVGEAQTGTLLLGFGLAGLLLGTYWGALTDRFGAVRCGIVASVATAACVSAVGLVTNSIELAAIWTAAGCGASMMTVAMQNLTVRAIPENKGGALSIVSAFRFSGAAIAPLLWLPIYTGNATTAFLVAGCSVLIAIPALAALPRIRTAPIDSLPTKETL